MQMRNTMGNEMLNVQNDY